MFGPQTDTITSPNAGNSVIPCQISWQEWLVPVHPFLKRVEERLTEQIRTFEPEIAEVASYAIANQGKHLRSALVAVSGNAEQGFNGELVQAAVIIEMVHLATLVHDDIMDSAELRRSRPTLANLYGTNTAVLLGDCLFAHALQLASAFPTPEVCRAVSSATKRVCTGEIIQTLRQSKPVYDREDYFRILEMKTAELFALACKLGAFLGGALHDHDHALRNYGLALGTAYQVFDDCLDIFGTEATIGKSLGTDLMLGKATLPVLILLEKVTPRQQEQVRAKLFPWDQRQMAWLRGQLRQHGALEASCEHGRRFLSAARHQLACIPALPASDTLRSLIDMMEQHFESLNANHAPAASAYSHA